MAALQSPQQQPQPFFHRPRLDGPRYDGYRPRYPRYTHSAGARFRPPGYAGQINDARGPRPWIEHRPGYTPNSSYNQGMKAKKSAHRKTIDYNATVLRTLQNRLYMRDSDEAATILPDSIYMNELTTPSEMRHNPMNCVLTKFVRQSTNKIRCPIFCVCWTPEGRRLVTGASSGEFTLWNGLTFNFETILQAHDSSIRSMIWSHDDNWMMTADHNGFVKYWQSNMNNVQMFQAHKEAIRGLSFCPTDNKFASCSDDGTVRIFDFATCVEERILKGHGADVKCVDWHPQKSIIVSGSKDSQQPIKLWDARVGNSLSTIHAHKSTVMSMKWNKNGNWFLTASRDHLLKLFDIRNMKSDFQTFKGHQKEATVISWHPIYEDFFASGGSDGAIKFWSVGTDKEVGANDTAHDGFIWSMAWHPLGHILVTGSNDHSTKFWARNKPGDSMKDRYNLNLLPIEDEQEDQPTGSVSGFSSSATTELPGMGIDEEMIEQIRQANSKDGIPGLDIDGKDMGSETFLQEKRGRYIYTKRVDRSFAAAWEGKAPPPNRQPDASVPSLLGDHPFDGKSANRPSGGLLDHPGDGGSADNQYNNGERNAPPNSKSWQSRNSGPYRAQNPSYNSDFRGPRPGFSRPPHQGNFRSEFRGPRPDFRSPRPDFNSQRGDFRGPRPNFRGQQPNRFNSPRSEFRDSRPNFNGPRGPPGNQDSEGNQNEAGSWSGKVNEKSSWNGPGQPRNQNGGYNRPSPY